MSEKEFESSEDWRYFCLYIIKSNRYILNDKWSIFLEAILSTAKQREEITERDYFLFRARINNRPIKESDYDYYCMPLADAEISAPPPDKTTDGRANPHGISVLYLANKPETAIAEVRPWLGQIVTVGQFKLNQGLKIINMAKDKKGLLGCIDFYGNYPKLKQNKEKADCVWSAINTSFSEPVKRGDEKEQYIPTQYLSEFFKTHGYDGILYKSSLYKGGYNLVLFDPKNANLTNKRLYEIKSINYESELVTNQYT